MSVDVWNETPISGEDGGIVTHCLDGKTELEPIVDRDIAAFAEFYAKTLANGNLTKYEAAAIKTYIHWKTHPEKK